MGPWWRLFSLWPRIGMDFVPMPWISPWNPGKVIPLSSLFLPYQPPFLPWMLPWGRPWACTHLTWLCFTYILQVLLCILFVFGATPTSAWELLPILCSGVIVQQCFGYPMLVMHPGILYAELDLVWCFWGSPWSLCLLTILREFFIFLGACTILNTLAVVLTQLFSWLQGVCSCPTFCST